MMPLTPRYDASRMTRLICGFWLMLLCSLCFAQQAELPRFEGRQITVDAPKLDDDGLFFVEGKDGASVCIEGPPIRQCYTGPKEYGRVSTAEVIEIGKDKSALLFSASSNGVSGWEVHFALLRPGAGGVLDNLFLGGINIANQNQHRFLDEPSFSAARIFVTAEFVWGRDEGHYGPHRFVISAYAIRPSLEGDNSDLYYLQDRYMTARTYDLDAGADILAAEKPEILARLRRVKAEQDRQPHSDR